MAWAAGQEAALCAVLEVRGVLVLTAWCVEVPVDNKLGAQRVVLDTFEARARAAVDVGQGALGMDPQVVKGHARGLMSQIVGRERLPHSKKAYGGQLEIKRRW